MHQRDELVLAIERDRRELHQALEQVSEAGHELRERLDPTRLIAVRPLPWLAGGFVAGALLGLKHAWNAASEGGA